MAESARGHVRPTKRCLDDLDLPFPSLTLPLGSLDHPLVRKAQSVPDDVASGGAERIRSLTDRVWFKCKVRRLRAAVTHLDVKEREVLDFPETYGEWWIGAAGERRADSSSDFYVRTEAHARRSGRGSGGADSSALMPGDLDRERLLAELAALTHQSWRRVVRHLLARSMRHGKPFSVEFSHYRVTAHVGVHDENDAYLAICSEGIWDPKIIALILSCVPGVPPDDWQAEPGGVLGIKPAEGQVIWSTVIPPEVQVTLLASSSG